MKKRINETEVEMVAVESRNISYVGYSEEKKFLVFEFIRGPVYVYDDVPKSTYDTLLSSTAIDDYFNDSVKNSFKNRRIM